MSPSPLAPLRCFSTVEVVENILDSLPLPSLMAFAATNRMLHEAVIVLFQHRILRLLSRFFDFPHRFLHCLHHVAGIFSGSAVLKLIFAMECSVWTANDLDVYIGYDQSNILIEFLRESGFHSGQSSSFFPYSLGSIHSITTFRRGSRKVDIIQSTTSSPLTPIFEFHLTAVMNFISADSIFSAYPALTSRHRAIVNPMLFEYGRLPLRTLSALLKYRDRGFLIQSTVQSWIHDHRFGIGPGHVCGRAVACSERQRTTGDNGCFRIRVFNGSADNDTVSPIRAISWRLGGRRCTMQLGYDHPYVITL